MIVSTRAVSPVPGGLFPDPARGCKQERQDPLAVIVASGSICCKPRMVVLCRHISDSAVLVLVVLGSGQQDIGRQVALVENPSVIEPRRCIMRLAATTIGRSDTALGAVYRRLSARAEKAKAVTATARKIAVLFYNSLR